jgi:hypothetical protein
LNYLDYLENARRCLRCLEIACDYYVIANQRVSCDTMASSRNEHNKNDLLGAHTIPNPAWKAFVCGWGAAFINITVTFPINKVMFRQVIMNF